MAESFLDQLLATDEQQESRGENRENVVNSLLGTNGADQSQPVDFDALTMVGNIPESGVRYLGEMWNAVTSPVDTVKAMGAIFSSALVMGGRKVNELVTGLDLEPGPGEAEAEAVGRFFMQRYGSEDQFKQTLMKDPVGVLADFSTVLFAGAGALGKASKAANIAGGSPGLTRAAEVTQKVATAAEPYRAIKGMINVAAGATVRKIPALDAEKLYQSAAKFSTTMGQKELSQLINTAMEYGVMPTAKGVAKVEGHIDALDHLLDDIVAEATRTGTTIPKKDILRYIGALRQSVIDNIALAGADLDTIRSVVREFGADLSRIPGKTLTPTQVQKLKKRVYKQAKYERRARQDSARAPMGEQTYRQIGRGAKESITDAVPEAAELNAEMAKLLNLQPELERAAIRIENRDVLGLGMATKVTAGSVAGGPPGAALGLVATALDHPKLKAGLALALNRAARGDTQWLRNNMHLPEVRLALSLMGSAEQSVSQEQ